MASKVYSIKYTDANLPKARDPITISAGKWRCVRIPFLTEGYITRLVIKQTGGESIECDVELLDSVVPYPVGEMDAGTAPDDDVDLYQIIESQTVPAGTPLRLIHEEYGFPFHNQDGTFTDNQRYLYLILAPGGGLVGAQGAQTGGAADTTTWELALTGHNEIG
jgi:hypothetical protein